MRLFILTLLVLPACLGQVSGPIDSQPIEHNTSSGPNNGPAGGDADGGDAATGGDTDPGGDASGGPTDVAPPRVWPAGDPGCGLTSAAFCDTFDARVASPHGRSYELDSKHWSLARNQPDYNHPMEIGSASISGCRSDVPAEVSPPGDTRICDGTDNLQSNHLMTVTAAQNYGTNSYRIRQPFDFASRTGTIVFDADATAIGLLGWIAIAVTEDPLPSPSFSVTPGAGNFEGGVIPKNGITVELFGSCGSTGSKVYFVNEYRDYVDYFHNEQTLGSQCFTTAHHRLNRFKLEISQTHLALWATPVSDDGVTFGTEALVASANLGLTFTRGYVQLVSHNHATGKYWTPSYPADAHDAWVVRWDNVGFDGPVINNTREFEVPDALVPASDARIAVGYRLGDVSEPIKTTVTIRDVADVSRAVRARLAMHVQYMGNNNNVEKLSTWGLTYRLNGRTWHTYDFTSAEETLYASGVSFQGDLAGSVNANLNWVLGHVFDIALDDLVEGDNVLEIATVDVPGGGYPQTLSNVDLILTDP